MLIRRPGMGSFKSATIVRMSVKTATATMTTIPNAFQCFFFMSPPSNLVLMVQVLF